MCAHRPKCRVLDSKQETGPLCSLALSYFGRLLGWKKSSQKFRLFLQRYREDTPRYIILFFSKVKLKEKRSTDMSTTSSEPRLRGSGNSQWSIDGTIASPGPWKPPIAPLTLWPSEHSDTRCFKSTQRSYIKHPINTSTSPSLPSFLLLAEGLKTLIQGPTFSLSWFRLLYPYRIPFLNQNGGQGEIRWLRKPPSFPSDLCLQVNDVLTHQRNGGAGLLPLHRVQLQRWGS